MSRVFSSLSPGVRPKVRNAIQELRSMVDSPFGLVRYVSRNRSVSGDGKSRDTCYITLGEAIAEVNAAFAAAPQPHAGRNNIIWVGEGWYGEVPLTLTASDTWIIADAPGFHDSVVLYGSATAGGFDIGAGGPALSLRGHNCSIMGLGLFTYDVLYPALRIGANASDPDGPAVSTVVGNAIIGCNFVRDVADGCLGGILDYGADGTLVDGCYFGTSQKDYAVRAATNGVINPVNPVYHNNRIIGVPKGFKCDAGHNIEIAFNSFHDDTSDRDDTVDEPIELNGATVRSFNNWSTTTNKAGIVTVNSGTSTEAGNYGTDSAT